ncbi:MAG: class I SAM-dependent methyltransferase [Cyclobacteriaceae bacterium]|nr:class I SAM-dependent methyltransferase [Cyclobacteriaceae bacterium]
MSLKSDLQYRFSDVEFCNMCGSPVHDHKVLGRRLNRSQGGNPRCKVGITTTIVKCSHCELIYSNPQPIPVRLQDHYGVKPETYWSEDYFKVEEQYFHHELRKAKELLHFEPGMKSLDIGAGLGKAMIALSKAGFDAYGFEPSSQFYDRAVTKMGIDPGKLQLGMIEQVSYPMNHFDFISFGAVLEHLYNPSDAILKALGWLKPKGVIHIEVPSSKWLVGQMLNLYYRLMLTDYVTNLSPMHQPYHLYEFGIKSFQEHAQRNNYQVLSHEYYVCETFLPRVLDYVLKPWMKATNKGMQLCVWLGKSES